MGRKIRISEEKRAENEKLILKNYIKMRIFQLMGQNMPQEQTFMRAWNSRFV